MDGPGCDCRRALRRDLLSRRSCRPLDSARDLCLQVVDSEAKAGKPQATSHKPQDKSQNLDPGQERIEQARPPGKWGPLWSAEERSDLQESEHASTGTCERNGRKPANREHGARIAQDSEMLLPLKRPPAKAKIAGKPAPQAASNDSLPTTRSSGQTPTRRRDLSRGKLAQAPDSFDTNHPHQHPPKDLPQHPSQHPPQP